MFSKTLLAGIAAAVVALYFSLFGSQEDPLQRADNAFDRKEYGQALAAYQTAAKLPELAKEREHIQIRIGVTLARLDRFDESLAALESFANEKTSLLGV